MSISEQYNDVISGLLAKTKTKKAIWNTTTDDDTFIVYFEKFSLSVKRKYRCDFNGNIEETWISVDLINDLGDRIDGFIVEPIDDDWNKMIELHTLARRSALSIDDAIKEMLTELNKEGIIGKKKQNDNISSNEDNFADDIPF
jgi:hypothetical protein